MTIKVKKMKIVKLLSLMLIAMSFSTVAMAKEKKKKVKLEPGMYAEIKTSKGTIMLELEFETTPMTVANFVGLAEGNFSFKDSIKINKPFYDGLKFHRVIADFMIQGGDPEGNGSGGTGYKFYDEVDTEFKHSRPGVLSMANSGPATNGSQFFITHKETPWLDGKHTIFGFVISGQDVVNAIAQDDIIEKITIIRSGKVAKKWNATKVFNEVYSKIEADYEKRVKELEKIASMSEQEYSDFMFDEYKKIQPNAQRTASGLVYLIEEEGEGPKPTKGTKCSIHYTGTFRTTWEKFDSSRDRGAPMEFQYQVQRMIPGFEEGIGMLGKGGKAKLVIPYYQAYGPKGRPGAIPPYSDLVFDIEVIDIVPTSEDSHEGHDHPHGEHDGHNH